MNNNLLTDIEKTRYELLSSFKLFIQTFYKLRTGKDFRISNPPGRESHHIRLIRDFIKIFKGETKRLLINIPPRYGKTEICAHFVAWSLAHYPDSNFIYVSNSHTLAKKATQIIKNILDLLEYQIIFGVKVSDYSSAKDNFETSVGGCVYAVGTGGTVTGRGAGVQGVDRFAGALIIDDIHKSQDIYSDTIRKSENEFYFNTLKSRLNDPKNTPIIGIGQRLHEDDFPGNIIKGVDGEWDATILKALDDKDYALDPEMHTKSQLQGMLTNKSTKYIAYSQYQQEPIPVGGALYEKENFAVLVKEPEIISAFITVDTAETDKSYNDATVFSFWGVYNPKIEEMANFQGEGPFLHWIDCLEIRCEPKDLLNNFLQFYARCMQFTIKPSLVAIEKKSTGVSLISYLKELRGIRLLEIDRHAGSGSKITRFINAQYYIASRMVSFTLGAAHYDKCINHMIKITDNGSHAHDDICDTCIDAIKIGIIDDIFRLKNIKSENDYKKIMDMSYLKNQDYSKNLSKLWTLT
jgi:hypothetical protein